MLLFFDWIVGSCQVRAGFFESSSKRAKEGMKRTRGKSSDPTLKPRSGGREQLVTNFNSWRFCVSENWLTTRQKDSMQGWSSVKPPKKVWLNYDLSIGKFKFDSWFRRHTYWRRTLSLIGHNIFEVKEVFEICIRFSRYVNSTSESKSDRIARFDVKLYMYLTAT